MALANFSPLIILFCLAVSHASRISTNEDATNNLKQNLQERQPVERLILAATRHLHPQSFSRFPPLEEEYYENVGVDLAGIDLRSMLTQFKKVDASDSLPEAWYFFRFVWCGVFDCWETHYTLSTGQSRIVGAKDITSQFEITPTFIRNTYIVPRFKWSSPGYLFNVTDVTDRQETLYRDFHLTVENMRIDMSANYSHDPQLGIQISNFAIDFGLDLWQETTENILIRYADGTESQLGPATSDETQLWLDNWDEFKEEYVPHLEFRINCVLSGGRVDPVECNRESGTGDGPSNVRYYKMNVLQIFGNAILGSLSRA